MLLIVVAPICFSGVSVNRQSTDNITNNSQLHLFCRIILFELSPHVVRGQILQLLINITPIILDWVIPNGLVCMIASSFQNSP